MTEEAPPSLALPHGWTKQIQEVSAGVYSVVVRDPFGHAASRVGTDPDELLNRCMADIKDLKI